MVARAQPRAHLGDGGGLGRPPRPLPVHRSLALALALVALGLGGVVLSHPTGAGYQPLLLLAGLVAVMLGVVLAAPAAIRAAAAPAARLPFATRLALRDLARYQARAAAALAAITLAISISVAIVGIAGANVRSADEGNMSSHQLVIRRSGEGTPVDPRIGAADRSALDVGAARVARALGDPTRVPLDIAIGANISDDPQTWDPVSVGRPMSASSTRMVAVAFVATPALLRHYGIDPSTIGDRTDLLTARKGNLSLVDVTTRGGAHPTTERGRPPVLHVGAERAADRGRAAPPRLARGPDGVVDRVEAAARRARRSRRPGPRPPLPG